MDKVKNQPLIYQNPEFAIGQLVANCPPSTVIRELTMNAIEAASLASPRGQIEWFIEQVGGVRKLGLYNEGPGMSGGDLARLMDLASTGKTLGAKNNYGQGGKISALRVSPHGVVYRSCKNGVVAQIVLAAEDRGGDYPVYVKKRIHVGDGDWETVVDVTEDYQSRLDRSLAYDWTEVVLLGTSPDHDTVERLIPTDDVKNWLLRHTNRRFYRFPAGVKIAACNITTGQRSARRTGDGLEDLVHRYSEADRRTDVEAVHERFGAVTIRYIKLNGTTGDDESKTNSRRDSLRTYGISTAGDHVTLVWKNECYDFRPGWSRIAGAMGVFYGAADVAVHILIPETAPVKNNTYRDAIIDIDGEHQPVKVDEFAALVRANRPQWLLDYIEQLASDNRQMDAVMDRLRQFLTELEVFAGNRPRLTDDGGSRDQGELGLPASRGKGKTGGKDKPKSDPGGEKTRPATGKRLPMSAAGIPTPQFTNDPQHLEEMKGRAALYRKEDNLILLNPQHHRYLTLLEKIQEEAGTDDVKQQIAKQVFDEEYSFQVGKYVVSAWMYKSKPDWDDEDWDRALSNESLTIYLTPPDCLTTARQKFRQRFRGPEGE